MTRTISVRLWRDAILIHFLFLRLKHTRPGERYRTLQIFQSVRVNSEITCQPSVFRAVNSPLIPKPPKPKVFVYLLFCFFSAHIPKNQFLCRRNAVLLLCADHGDQRMNLPLASNCEETGKIVFFRRVFLSVQQKLITISVF